MRKADKLQLDCTFHTKEASGSQGMKCLLRFPFPGGYLTRTQVHRPGKLPGRSLKPHPPALVDAELQKEPWRLVNGIAQVTASGVRSRRTPFSPVAHAWMPHQAGLKPHRDSRNPPGDWLEAPSSWQASVHHGWTACRQLFVAAGRGRKLRATRPFPTEEELNDKGGQWSCEQVVRVRFHYRRSLSGALPASLEQMGSTLNRSWAWERPWP